jgi:TetR/AcrR family transcriptional regulator, transcriptional repressor for nem operon
MLVVERSYVTIRYVVNRKNYARYVMLASAMKHSSEKSQTSKQRIVEAAGQAFRKHGLGGIGVDGLAKGANFTSGAFYFHFASKLDAFVESVRNGLDELRQAIVQSQSAEGRSWLVSFASFYMGFKRRCDLEQGCSLPILSSEVERAGKEARSVYEEKLVEVANAVARGLGRNPSKSDRDRAWVILALLSGGVTMARTVRDKALSEEIAKAVEKAVVAFGVQDKG